MYNPLELTEKVEETVIKNSQKKYFRFRPTKFYRGVSTADTLGCNLLCKFCWNFNRNQKTKEMGEFYSPEEVANKLTKMAESKDYHQLRISGGEPTIGRKHLLEVLENVPGKYHFILETNGILIGENQTYSDQFSQFDNTHVRVSLKGADKGEFSRLTGARPEFYTLQLKALENLRLNNVSYHASVMSLKDDFSGLRKKLSQIDPSMQLEVEQLKLYNHVKRRMKQSGLI